MKKIFSFAALLLITTSAIAQTEGSSVYLGIAMPRKGYSAGPVIGYKYQYNLPLEGLGLIGAVDFTLNGWNKKTSEISKNTFNGWLSINNYDDADTKTKYSEPTNFAIPINFGVNYSYPFGRIRAWAEAAIGFAPVFTSRQVWKADEHESVSYESTTSKRPHKVTNSGWRHNYQIVKYRPTVAFSWKIALGGMLDQKYSLGLDIDGLSKHRQKTILKEDVKPYWNSEKNSYTRETEGENMTKGFAYVSLRFGYHF